MSDRENLIVNRKFIPCPSTADWSVPQLVLECPHCTTFLMYCCSCNNRALARRQDGPPPGKHCHHFHVVFTDGACTNNGRPEAKAGIGLAYGTGDLEQMVIPITDKIDKFPVRSNQRAELLAAGRGVKMCAFFREISFNGDIEDPRVWIIATDSEYAVKGITEWLPTWRVRLEDPDIWLCGLTELVEE